MSKETLDLLKLLIGPFGALVVMAVALWWMARRDGRRDVRDDARDKERRADYEGMVKEARAMASDAHQVVVANTTVMVEVRDSLRSLYCQREQRDLSQPGIKAGGQR